MAKPWCKHYRGMYEKELCAANVRFDSLPNYGTQEFMRTCPCFAPSVGCELAVYPTAEEMAAHDAEMNARFAQIGVARQAIVAACGGPWKRGTSDSSGVIECPNCNGKLHYSRSGYNGHIHARCETKSCVSWME
jgi:hypothetical protein